MDEEVSSHQKIAMMIAKSSTQTERETIKTWLRELLEIRDSNISTAEKTKRALSITRTNKVVLPIAKLIFRESKRNLWDDRNPLLRRFALGTAAGLAAVGGGGAGIAMMGSAFGLPLWLVFSGGAVAIPAILKELEEHNEAMQEQKPSKTTRTAMDAEKESVL